MVITKEFQLIRVSGSLLPNIMDVNQATLRAFTLKKEDAEYLKSMALMFLKSKGVKVSPVFIRAMNKSLIIRLDKYPLVGTCLKDHTPVLNLHPLVVTDIADYHSSDIATMFIYSISFASFIKAKSFKVIDLADTVSNFYFSVFMKLFGKSGGLLGAYKDLIPILRFFIRLYVEVALGGVKFDDKLIHRISSIYFVDTENLRLDVAPDNIDKLFQLLRDNAILNINLMNFTRHVIGVGGMQSLPMFEDISRLFSTLIASSIPGNSIFTTFWKRVNQSVYNALVTLGMKHFYIDVRKLK